MRGIFLTEKMKETQWLDESYFSLFRDHSDLCLKHNQIKEQKREIKQNVRCVPLQIVQGVENIHMDDISVFLSCKYIFDYVF